MRGSPQAAAAAAVSYGRELRRTCRWYKRASSVTIDPSLTVKWRVFTVFVYFYPSPTPTRSSPQQARQPPRAFAHPQPHLRQSKYISKLATRANSPISSRGLIWRARAAACSGRLMHEFRTRREIRLAHFPRAVRGASFLNACTLINAHYDVFLMTNTSHDFFFF